MLTSVVILPCQCISVIYQLERNTGFLSGFYMYCIRKGPRRVCRILGRKTRMVFKRAPHVACGGAHTCTPPYNRIIKLTHHTHLFLLLFHPLRKKFFRQRIHLCLLKHLESFTEFSLLNAKLSSCLKSNQIKEGVV